MYTTSPKTLYQGHIQFSIIVALPHMFPTNLHARMNIDGNLCMTTGHYLYRYVCCSAWKIFRFIALTFLSQNTQTPHAYMCMHIRNARTYGHHHIYRAVDHWTSYTVKKWGVTVHFCHGVLWHFHNSWCNVTLQDVLVHNGVFHNTLKKCSKVF